MDAHATDSEQIEPSDGQRRFIERHSPCRVRPASDPDSALVYCYGTRTVTRYLLSHHGNVLDMASFQATEGDLAAAAALDAVSRQLEALYAGETYEGPQDPEQRLRSSR